MIYNTLVSILYFIFFYNDRTGLQVKTLYRIPLCDKCPECTQQGMVDRGHLWCGERSADSRTSFRGIDSQGHPPLAWPGQAL